MTKTPPVVTLQMLEDARACAQQRALFVELFPDGAVVSVELCQEMAVKFDWHWAATNLLSGPALEQYVAAELAAMERYVAVERPDREQYDKDRAVAFAEAALNHGLDVQKRDEAATYGRRSHER